MSVKISIIVPLYNKETHIERALSALFQQASLPYEIIIIDDASTDNSMQTASQFITKQRKLYPNIKQTLIRNQTSIGLGATRNKGIDIAAGDYLLFMNTEDEFQPLLLAHTQQLIVKQKADMIILGYRRLPEIRIKNSWLKSLNWLNRQRKNGHLFIKPLDIILQGELPLGPGTNAVIRTSVLSSIRYDETSHIFEGINFWFRVLQTIERDNGLCLLFKEPYYSFFSLPDSLSQPIQLTEFILPESLKSNNKITNIHEQQLLILIAKTWIRHNISHLPNWSKRIAFLWRYKHLIFYFFQSTAKEY